MDNIDSLKQQLQAADTDWKKTIISVEIVKVISEARDPHSVPMVLYNIPNFTLQDAVLHGADLDDAKLEGVNLQGADLTSANLSWADLSGANLSWAHLVYVNLNHAYMVGANLSDAILTHAQLRRADLSGANLKEAYLVNAIMDVANLHGADLSGANLHSANLEYANLEYANLTGAKLIGVNLVEADMKSAILQGANLESSELMGSFLEGADLTDANLQNVDLTGANLTGANLTGANLTDADLTDADLTDADLTDAILEGAILEGVVGLDDAQVQIRPGLAYEIHNAFSVFQPKETEYLALINQPDFEGEDILDNIYDQFYDNIYQLFQGDDLNLKAEQFNKAFEKSKNLLKIVGHRQLIYKSVRFAFSQDDDFKREYIKNFLDETCNAYSGSGDNTSCAKGIIERYVLSVGNAVQNICSDGCSNETYKKLDKLMNPKFNIAEAASTWWETEAIKEDIKAMDKEGRKANFIEYLMAEAKRLNSETAQTATEIENYANGIDYAFTELVLGGKKSRRFASKTPKKQRGSKKRSKKTTTRKSGKRRKTKRSSKSR